MTTSAPIVAETEARRLHIVDCDIHPRISGLADLFPYLSSAWRARIAPKQAAKVGRGSEVSRNAFSIPKRSYFHPGEAYRVDAFDEQGNLPGTSLHMLQEQLLNKYSIDYAIIVGQDGTGVSGIADPDLAGAFCSAYNDYMLEHFVDQDQRCKLSIWVGPRDPILAANEIHRLADHPGVVQVQVSPSDTLLGNRHFLPIYEAAVEHDLPVAIHGGAESAGVNGPLMLGTPTYYMEVHSGLVQGAWAHLSSLVCEGVFERLPALKFVIQEMGYAWIPAWLWRMDKEWKSLRSEVPWLSRPPSEYVLEHVRFTSQPVEEPPSPRYHDAIVEMMHGAEILLFSTDYPHWDFDNPEVVLKMWADVDTRRRIAGENAAQIYGLTFHDDPC